MKVKTQDYNNVTVVELRGEFNGDSNDMLRQTVSNLIAEHKAGVVLDMSEVNFIDSQGLEQLLWLKDYCHENHCELKLAVLDENCAKILEITQLDKAFDSHVELAEAVKSFA